MRSHQVLQLPAALATWISCKSIPSAVELASAYIEQGRAVAVSEPPYPQPGVATARRIRLGRHAGRTVGDRQCRHQARSSAFPLAQLIGPSEPSRKAVAYFTNQSHQW